MTTKVGRPSKAYMKTLRKPKAEDYEKMVLACVTALLTDQTEVIIKLPYVAKLPKSFPRATVIHREGLLRCRVHNAKILLAWLRQTGKTTISPDSMGVELRKLTLMEKELTCLL
jgi:hypothetical protein